MLPSEYVPVAVNCCVVPFGIDGFAGVTAIDTRVAGPTVKVDSLLDLFRPYGVKELVRTGVVAMSRGQAGSRSEKADRLKLVG